MKAYLSKILFLIFVLTVSAQAQYQNDTTCVDPTGVEYYLGIDEFSYPVGGDFNYCFGVTNGSPDTLYWAFGYCNYNYDFWLTDEQTGDTIWVWSWDQGFFPMILNVSIPPDSSWIIEYTASFYSYTIGNVPPGNYLLLGRWIPGEPPYGLTPIWTPTLTLPVAIEELIVGNGGSNQPCDFLLYQNHPNPFNAETVIAFSLPRQSDINLSIYDIAGRLVKILAQGNFGPGPHEMSFDGKDISSGIYLYHLTTEDYAASKKMLLIK